MLKDLEIKKVFGSQFVSLWYRTNRFHVAVIDQRRRQNVVTTSVTHSAIALCAIFCSYHILTSSVIYYWTGARKHGIFLLNAPQFSKLRALWKRFEGCLSQQPPFGANLCSDICPWTYLQFSCSLDTKVRQFYTYCSSKFSELTTKAPPFFLWNTWLGHILTWKGFHGGQMKMSAQEWKVFRCFIATNTICIGCNTLRF